MPLNYGKFDHIEDSDDEKPDPKEVELKEARRRQYEEMCRKMDEGPEAKAAAEVKKAADAIEEAKPFHQKDHFAYSDQDASKLAQDMLSNYLRKTPSVKIGRGVLSVAKVEKVQGEADRLIVKGQNRYIFDLKIKLLVAFQWMGLNFDEGPQRAEGNLEIEEFTNDTPLEGVGSGDAPVCKMTWTDAASLSDTMRKDVDKAFGTKSWPAPEGSFMAHMAKIMKVFVEELPNQIGAANVKAKIQREEAAADEAEELAEQEAAAQATKEVAAEQDTA